MNQFDVRRFFRWVGEKLNHQLQLGPIFPRIFSLVAGVNSLGILLKNFPLDLGAIPARSDCLYASTLGKFGELSHGVGFFVSPSKNWVGWLVSKSKDGPEIFRMTDMLCYYCCFVF